MTKWQALHIHRHAGQDDVLADCIAPLIAGQRTRGLAGWFFLRYWEGGPHLRLRIRLDSESDDMAALHSEIARFLTVRPSTGRLPDARLSVTLRDLGRLEGMTAVSQLIADDAVLPRPYEPEFTKYGGPRGVEIAEELFEASSDAALEALGAIRSGRGERLGTAFAMLLAAARAGGKRESAGAEFFAAYCRFWSRYVGPDGAASWADRLAAQERALVPHAAAVLAGPVSGSEPEDGGLGRWHAAVARAVERLDRDAERILPAVTLAPWAASPAARRDFVLLNYVHTHNNRLGVLPAQEAYLAYLAHHVVCRLAGLPARNDLVPEAAAVHG